MEEYAKAEANAMCSAVYQSCRQGKEPLSQLRHFVWPHPSTTHHSIFRGVDAQFFHVNHGGDGCLCSVGGDASRKPTRAAREHYLFADGRPPTALGLLVGFGERSVAGSNALARCVVDFPAYSVPGSVAHGWGE